MAILVGGLFVAIAPASTAGPLCAVTFAYQTSSGPVAGGTFASTMANGATTALPLANGAEIVRAGLASPVASAETITITFPSGTTFNGALAANHFLVRVFAAGIGGCTSSSGTDGAPSSWRNPASMTGPGTSDPPVVTLTMAGTNWLPTGGTARGTLVVAASSAGTSKIFHPCAPAGAYSVATSSGDSASGSVSFGVPAGTTATAAVSAAFASPGSVTADGVSAATITVHAKDMSAKACTPNKRVIATSNRGALDLITPPAPGGVLTDAWGAASFTATSCSPGAPVYSAVALNPGSASDAKAAKTATTTFTPAAASCPVLSFAQQPLATGQALPFVPVVAVRATDPAGTPLVGTAITLRISGSPGAAMLVNGPGQDVQPSPPAAPTPPLAPYAASPVALTDASGTATFPGLAILVDDPLFEGADYQLKATAGTSAVVSEPFALGMTSPPWTQFNFNAQRTGWSPNIADFSDPLDRTVIAHVSSSNGAATETVKAFGDVNTAPLLVDENGDGMLDLILVNAVNKGTTSQFVQPVVQAVDVYNGGGFIWKGLTGSGVSADGVAGGNIVTHLASVRAPGATGPTTLAMVTANAGPAPPPPSFRPVLYLWGPGGAFQSLASNAPPVVGFPLPAPLLIGNIGPGGTPALVLAAFQSAGATAAPTTVVEALPITAGNKIGLGPTATVQTPLMFGGATALGELRPGNQFPEIVVALGHQGTGGSGGWDSGTVILCTVAATIACPEQNSLTDAAINGLSIADLDGDGALDIVANGLRSGTWSASAPSQGQLNVYPGSDPVLGAPDRLAEGSDFYNTAALGNLYAADQDGPSSIVNVNYGAPPLSDDTAGDTYSDIGDVYVRNLDAAGIVPEAVWNRGGTSSQPKESPGGILLTLDPSPAHGYRPDYVFGSKDGTVVGVSVKNAPATGPSAASSWTIGGLGSLSGSDATQGIPQAPLVAGDVTGDCHAELFAGLSMGASTRGEVAVIKGKDASSPGGPLWNSPIDYDGMGGWTGATLPDEDTAPGYGFKAKLAWNRPASDGGLPIVAYKVFRTTGLPDNGGPTGAWQYVGLWPSGTPPTFAAGTAPTYRPFIDNLATDGDYYYRVAAVTCFTLAQDPNNDGSHAGDYSLPYFVEVRFGKTGDLRAVPSGDPAYPLPVQVNIAWERLDNYDRPHGCEWVSSYNLYKSTTGTNVVAPGNKITTAPWPTAGGPTAPATYAYKDLAVVRAGWDGAPDTDGNGAGGLYHYVVNPVNCVGEENVDPNPPYNNPASNQILGNTRVPKPPVLDSLTLVATGVRLDWTPDPIINGCEADVAGLGGTILGYQIYRGDSAGTATLYDTVLAAGPYGPPAKPEPWWTPNPTVNPLPALVPITYIDTGAASDESYYYQVATVNCVGKSLRSNERTFEVPILPITPTDFTARPYGNPAFAAAGPKKVQLDWTALANADWGDCTGGRAFEIHRGPPGGPYTLQETLLPAANTWTDSGAVAGFPIAVGSTYAYQIKALCTTPLAMESPFSEEATAAVTLPDAPVLSPATVGDAAAVELSWPPAPASNNPNCDWIEGYRIYRGTAGPGSEGVTPYFTVRPAGIATWPRALYTTSPGLAATTWTDSGSTYSTTYYYKVTAVNCIGEGPPNDLSITVPPNTPPTAAISAAGGGTPGQAIAFTDASTDPDGTISCHLWDFGDGTTSTTPSPSHAYAKAGTYTVTLSICDDAGATSSATHTVNVAGTPEGEQGGGGGGLIDDPPAPPIQPIACDPLLADAGDDFAADEATRVTLSGSVCRMTHSGYDYKWRQDAGPTVDLEGANTPNATFLAPPVATGAPVVVTFAFQASQGSRASEWAVVNVTVVDVPEPGLPTINQAPLANAGADVPATAEMPVTLNAGASLDPDGDLLTYKWIQVAGPDVALSDPTSAAPTFTAPPYGAEHVLEFMLEVSDGKVVASDLVAVIVAPAAPASATAPLSPPAAPVSPSFTLLWIGLGLLAARAALWVVMAGRREAAGGPPT